MKKRIVSIALVTYFAVGFALCAWLLLSNPLAFAALALACAAFWRAAIGRWSEEAPPEAEI